MWLWASGMLTLTSARQSVQASKGSRSCQLPKRLPAARLPSQLAHADGEKSIKTAQSENKGGSMSLALH